jgi:hypothetical protein
VEIFEARHRDLMRQVLAGPSIYERAAEIVPDRENALLMQRIEDSNFRQVLRLSNLLIRLRREERQIENGKRRGISHDV